MSTFLLSSQQPTHTFPISQNSIFRVNAITSVQDPDDYKVVFEIHQSGMTGYQENVWDDSILTKSQFYLYIANSVDFPINRGNITASLLPKNQTIPLQQLPNITLTVSYSL